MSILSDREIKELCMIPNVEITEKVWEEYERGHYGTTSETNKRLTYCDESSLETLKKEIIKSNHTTGPSSFRMLTELERSILKPMISPFVPNQVRVDELGNKIISYGLSSYGYDVRLDNKFKIFTNINHVIVDPLNFDHKSYVDHEGDFCIVPPHSYILGCTIEEFNIPNDVLAICVGKSTYARSGAIVNVTPIEPMMKGKIVIEIANCMSLPLKIYANQGIAQFLFLKGNIPCDVSYSDRGGKYMNQSSIVTPIG